MRLFASAARGFGRRERCTSAPSTRPRSSVRSSPSSPLAQPLTTQKPPSTARAKSTRRKKNAVHPIDLRDLESELELLPEPREPRIACSDVAPVEPTLACGYTATVTVFHALDLHNPCQIRSCPHVFMPLVQLSIHDSPVASVDAAHHAKNHSSWAKSSHVTRHVSAEEAVRLCLLRVRVAVRCTRHPSEPTVVEVGSVDDIVISADQPGDIAQFYSVFRFQIVANRAVKYFAGKIKLGISIVKDSCLSKPKRVFEPNPDAPLSELAPEQREQQLCTPVRPSFLPVNFGDALQLQRKQLKAVVAPAIISRTPIKAADDPHRANELMDLLRAQASHHIFRVCDVEVLEAIGEGVHASVFRARVLDSAYRDVDLAIKEFRFNNGGSYSEGSTRPPLAVLQAFQQEYTMLATVTDCMGAGGLNTIRLVGVMLAPRLAIFTDYCDGGSLANCLQDQERWALVSLLTKLRLAHQIAAGVAGLHRHHIVHRDIKTHNVMISGLHTDEASAKIGDLGCAVTKLPSDAMLREETGSSGYTAPEVFGSRGYDHRADIWSLGIVLWELLLADSKSRGPLPNPFAGLCGDEAIRKAEHGDRPPLPDGALPQWCRSLLTQCWQLDPSLRPSASDIASAFRSAIAQAPP